MERLQKKIERAKACTVALWQDIGYRIWRKTKEPDEKIGESLGECAVDISKNLLGTKEAADDIERDICKRTAKRTLLGIKIGFDRRVDDVLWDKKE